MDFFCIYIYISYIGFILQKFIFRGRLIFGPDAKSLIITLLLIIVPVIIFCTNVARNLFDETPGNIAGYAILMVTVVFTIYVSSLEKTLCSVNITLQFNSFLDSCLKKIK